MNLELSQISEVPQALEILRAEVERAETAIRQEGAKAMTAKTAGSLKAAEEAIAYAKRLRAFIAKIDALGSEWQKIEASIAKATPGAREIVRKAGGTHVVTGPLEPKTNFTVMFPDGKVIAEPKANLTLARTIEAIGPSRVATLRGAACLRPNGEPLLTCRESELAKYPTAKVAVVGGWFLNTQSSTEAKVKTVKEISRQLKLRLKVKVVPGTFLQGTKASGEKPEPQTEKPHKTGFTHNVTNIAPKTTFTVRFPDGTVVSDKKAKSVLAKTIEKIGVEKVARLGILCGGEPLVTKDRSLLKKYPNAVGAISGGWFVKTHSSTAAKMNFVKAIAKGLGIRLTVANV